MMAMENIILEKYPNPTIPRGWGWMARFDGDDAEGFYGFGNTEQEAAEDLKRDEAAG